MHKSYNKLACALFVLINIQSCLEATTPIVQSKTKEQNQEEKHKQNTSQEHKKQALTLGEVILAVTAVVFLAPLALALVSGHSVKNIIENIRDKDKKNETNEKEKDNKDKKKE